MRFLCLLGIAALIAALAPAAAAQVASRCITNCNYWVTGKRIAGSGEDAASAGACQARCNANAACRGWMFWLPSNGMHPNMCELVGSGAATDYKPSSLALVSGLKSRAAAAPTGAAARTSTFLAGKFWNDLLTPIPALKGKGARSCMAACIADGKCTAWDYNNDKGFCRHYDIPLGRVILHASPTVTAGAIVVGGAAPAPAAAAPPGGAPVRTSTPQLDRGWSRYRSVYFPNDKTPTVTSRPECMAICVRDNKCKAWWHQPVSSSAEGRGLCALFTYVPEAQVEKPGDSIGIIRVAAATSPNNVAVLPGIPSNPRQALAAGQAAAQQGQHARAIELLNAALAANRLDPASRLAALRQRGYSFAILRRNDEAKADYDAALLAKPGDAATLARRALVLAAMGQAEAAKADAERAVAADPRLTEAFVARGTIREEAGDNDGAAADFGRAIALANTPVGKARAHAARGAVHRAAGRFDQALADLDRALTLQPDDTNALSLRGFTRIAAGRYDEARADFDRYAALAPNSAHPMRGRGLAEAARGNFALAAKEYANLAKALPSDSYAHIFAYLAQERGGQWSWPDMARAAARLDLKKWPAPAVHHLLGNLGAEALMAAAKHDDPKTQREQVCEAEFYIGQAALLAGDKAGARQRFERAAAVCPPNFMEATWAKAELARPASQP